MSKRQAKETLTQVKTRLTREQRNRTDARIRQLLPPPLAVKEEGDDLEEEWPEHSTIDNIDTPGERREVEARKSGLCERLLWVVCVVVLFGVCVVFCSVLLLVSLSKVTIVLQK